MFITQEMLDFIAAFTLDIATCAIIKHTLRALNGCQIADKITTFELHFLYKRCPEESV